MKKTLFILLFFNLIACKKSVETSNSISNSNETEKPVEKAKVCNKFSAGDAVISYLIKTGVIEYSSQAKWKTAVQINDDCDYRVTVTFYLENLYSGDGTKDYMVSFDGKEYFVH